MKTILELTSDEAKAFFMQQKVYCGIELPAYFDFQPLLDELDKGIGNSNLGDIQLNKPKDIEGVNYTFYSNKDARFDWRPFQLINPAIYVCLVNEITNENSWKIIQNRFMEFQNNKKIICYSIPIVNDEVANKNNKKETIKNWWKNIEQKSIELALDYNCMLNTDIVNCYGSIYSHSIPWALHTKQYSKAHRKQKNIGNKIDQMIQAMSYSQTNGIPQGSGLSDFIAEMVLGYADLELTDKICQYNMKNKQIFDYKILRYRDDYRIFTKSQEVAEVILKLLSEVLQDLNLKVNAQKTFISSNIIRDSIKRDKLYWNEAKQGDKSLQKHLLLIYSLAEKYPNSGSVVKALHRYYQRIYPLKKIGESNTNTLVLISILVDIMYKNPRVYPIACSILAKLLSLETEKAIDKIIQSIQNKFEMIPNIGHLQVWLQRITLEHPFEQEYDESLCKLVLNKDEKIWDIFWLKQDIKDIFKTKIIDNDVKKMISSIPAPSEINVFDEYNC